MKFRVDQPAITRQLCLRPNGIQRGVYNLLMVRTHLFFKVEIEHDEDDNPEKIGEEIGRHLRKLYVVRSVELSSVVTQPE